MRSKKIILAPIACLAVFALVASSARATWKVPGGSVPATVQLEKTGAENLKLTSTLLNNAVELTAEQIACASTCTINETPTADHSEGTLVFTGVTAMKPSSCSVKNPGGTAGTVSTEPLTDMVEMKTVSGSTETFDQFFPHATVVEGKEVHVFAEVEFTGTKCPLNEDTAPVEGFVYGETESTGTSLVGQPVRFDTAAASISALTLGQNPASLAGEVTVMLTGANAGLAFSSTGPSLPAHWTVVGGFVPATVSIEKMGTESLKLTSTPLNNQVELTAEHIACSGTCTIDETPTEGHSQGTLVFTGVTAMKPSSCTVSNPEGTVGTVTTEPLTDLVEMTTVPGTTSTFDKFFPDNEEEIFTGIEFTGSKCPLDELEFPIEGVLYGETEATGTSLVDQPVRFNAATNSMSGLRIGADTASLFGEATNSLTGANTGKAFSAAS